jgi:hypothetical protein
LFSNATGALTVQPKCGTTAAHRLASTATIFAQPLYTQRRRLTHLMRCVGVFVAKAAFLASIGPAGQESEYFAGDGTFESGLQRQQVAGVGFVGSQSGVDAV